MPLTFALGPTEGKYDMKRPKTLITAFVLLAAAYLYGIVQLVTLFRASTPNATPHLLLLVGTGLYLFLLGLLGLAALGRDWARFLGAVIALLMLLENVPELLSLETLALGWFVAKAGGLVLLYAPPSNRWFRRAEPNNSSKPMPLRDVA